MHAALGLLINGNFSQPFNGYFTDIQITLLAFKYLALLCRKTPAIASVPLS